MRVFPLSVCLYVISSIALAQAPLVPPDTPAQTNTPTDAPLNPGLPTVFVVGDSTARNGADLGWGDHFASLFDTHRINIANRAHAGCSSRTFINEGRWAHVLAEVRPGDYLLLQMGHNAGGALDGPKPRGSLKGIGPETQDVPQTIGLFAGKTETVHTYGWYLRKMIDETRARGVHPILLTLTIRNIWTIGPDGKPHIERDMGYNVFIREIAREEEIPVADMGGLEAERLEALGQTKAAALFPKDHTHTSAEGAVLNAIAVRDALLAAHLTLAAYLKPVS
jgi:lysophospholipase L1-like esterase